MIKREIECGAVYQAHIGCMSELAEVIAVHSDGVGIEHVRYRVEVRRNGGDAVLEERTLSMQCFKDRFGKTAANAAEPEQENC